MRINNISDTNFKGALNNKLILGALEKISDHSATFGALTAVGASLTLRPLAISLTPDVKKENKKHSIANSVSSGLIKLTSTCIVSAPIEYGIRKLEENPKKFLTPKAEEFLKDKNSFNFASQVLKLSSRILSAIPKSAMTILLIPLIAEKITLKNSKTPENNKEISFKGKLGDSFTKLVSKYFNSVPIQNFAKKNQANSVDIARNMTAIGDIALVGSFIAHTQKSKKIKPEQKTNLIYNSIISTGLSILAGIGLDSIVKEQGKNLVEKFAQANKNDPKLAKYLQGINVLRPTLIFAFVYYGILPFISNYFAQKISDNKISDNKPEQNQSFSKNSLGFLQIGHK